MRTIQSNDVVSVDTVLLLLLLLLFLLPLPSSHRIFVMTTATTIRTTDSPFHWFLKLISQLYLHFVKSNRMSNRGECLDGYSICLPSNYVIKTNELPANLIHVRELLFSFFEEANCISGTRALLWPARVQFVATEKRICDFACKIEQWPPTLTIRAIEAW